MKVVMKFEIPSNAGIFFTSWGRIALWRMIVVHGLNQLTMYTDFEYIPEGH
jgi:hypothetical protein